MERGWAWGREGFASCGEACSKAHGTEEGVSEARCDKSTPGPTCPLAVGPVWPVGLLSCGCPRWMKSCWTGCCPRTAALDR